MDNWTEAEYLFARLLGLPNDADALKLARRLQSLNRAGDVIKKQAERGIAKIIDRHSSSVQSRAA